MRILLILVILMHVLMLKLCNNSLIKKSICFKNPKYTSWIDLILTNMPRSFQTKCVVGVGLSDFYRMIIFVIKTHFRKVLHKVVSYRDFKAFGNERFMNLQFTLREESTDYIKNPDKSFELFHILLNTRAPKKVWVKRDHH